MMHGRLEVCGAPILCAQPRTLPLRGIRLILVDGRLEHRDLPLSRRTQELSSPPPQHGARISVVQERQRVRRLIVAEIPEDGAVLVAVIAVAIPEGAAVLALVGVAEAGSVAGVALVALTAAAPFRSAVALALARAHCARVLA